MASRRRFLQLGTVAAAGTAIPVAAVAPASAADHGTAEENRAAVRVRPPAVPLIVRSPYLSVWLAADNLPGSWPTFWTGRTTAMTGLAVIDGEPFLFMGSPAAPGTYPFATMRQISLTTTATKSEFVLQQAGVELTVAFLSPVSPGDLRRQSQPLSYVSTGARSVDGAAHRVAFYFDISGEWASGDAGRSITWAQSSSEGVVSLSHQQTDPQVLGEIADTAEWGTMVLSSPARPGLTWQIGPDTEVRAQLAGHGVLTGVVDADKPRRINDRWPVFAVSLDLGTVGRLAGQPFVVSIGHVREPAVSYLGERLPPLWKSYWADWPAMVAAFHADFAAAVRRSATLDAKIERDAVRAGGAGYAALCALAFRQAYAATELVSRNGRPWAFLKEISSNGNMSTVDVTYPAMPVFLYADPEYLALILAPVLDYAANHGYPKVFAPHDLGTHYPNADRHLTGTGEEDMPVEESANMLIMVAAYLKLAYDQDGTWSLKYNGYADRVLGLGLVPGSVARTEAAWYLSRAATDGVPLDVRHTYTKADWEMWTAAWLKDHTAVRDLLIDGLYRFADTSAQWVPMTDWYDTTANRQNGFQARPVVGGFFALLTV